MRWFFLVLAILTVTIVSALGPRGAKFTSPPFELFPDMDRQYKVKYQKPSYFFADNQGSRKPIAGTVPLGFVQPIDASAGIGTTNLDFSVGSDYYNTGKFEDFFGEGFPEQVKVDEEFLERGQQRFEINCTVCHGKSGNGQGVVSKYWAIPPTANLLDPRVKALPEGQLFWTITHGKGLMGPYNGAINVHDRWAIVAYVKALQASTGE
ncbi:cytochrome c [Verrucomicrobiales bacterium]|nr:cytochrome c [Verrucomicrobiales bacterium]MDC0259336.1 cytochrome c [Verrucomicrobiales bacterium]MDC0292012.1 cytochrome c [Verrucomicrobiales bacterium]MDC0322224.1 cytochrome c [Verrucomicrobiales bacterium]